MYEVYVIFYNDCGEYKETEDVCITLDIARARQVQKILEYYYKNTESIKTVVGFGRILKDK